MLDPANSPDWIIGFLRDISPYAILKALEQEARTCQVDFHVGERLVGTVYVREGEIVHAVTDGKEGDEALRLILEHPEIDVVLYEMSSESLPHTVQRSLDALLLEALKNQDEHRKIVEQLPGEEVLGQLEKMAWGGTKGVEQGGKTMANTVEKILEELSGVTGFEGAAAISEEGLVLASRFVTDVDEEKFAAFAQEAVTMAQNVVEIMGWGSLDNMTLESEDKHKLVLYRTKFGFVALFGNKSLNLGMARLKVDEAAEELEEEL